MEEEGLLARREPAVPDTSTAEFSSSILDKISQSLSASGARAPDNGSEPGEDGSHSSFGTLLAAEGGKRGTFGNPINGSPGGKGGSGGGAGGYDCPSPSGGMDGFN